MARHKRKRAPLALFNPNNYMHLTWRDTTLRLSQSVWTEFAYFRLLSKGRDPNQPFRVVLPDDFGELFALISRNDWHELDLDYATCVRTQALVLGLDPESLMAGHVEAVMYRCIEEHCCTTQPQDMLAIAWGEPIPRARRASTRALIREIFVRAYIPYEQETIDMRSVHQLRQFKNAHQPSGRHYEIQSRLLQLFQ